MGVPPGALVPSPHGEVAGAALGRASGGVRDALAMGLLRAWGQGVETKGCA